jgi:flagellar biosynthetic protein FlhB
MAHATPHAMPSEILAILMHDAAWILGAFGALAVIDLLFVRHEYLRQLRMSRRDLKDEAKRREGDPDVRAKRKRLMQELFKRTRSVARVADADVVLSNPSHLSVALQYRPSTMRAPIVIAKGTDGMALRMREVAWRAGVPHVHSPELARALFRITRLDAPVPEPLFVQLAPIYRWLMTRPGHRIL